MNSLKTIIYLLITATVLVGLTTVSRAQTVALPDTNMRNALSARYPDLMEAGELIISEANTFNQTLDLSNSNISNASGLEYFTSVASINLNNNNLIGLPDLSGASQLQSFYASNNQLQSLSDFSNATQLFDFQVYGNRLKQLPDLTNSKGLTKLYCADNQIERIFSLEGFTELVELVIGNNPIDHFIDFGEITSLRQLHIHNIGIDSIAGLSKLVNLEVLYAWGNNIEDFSGIDSNTRITTCVISDNKLTHLPYLANKPNLNFLDITTNYLSFDDIIEVVNLKDYTYLFYADQRPFSLPDLEVRENSYLRVNVPFDKNIDDNTYVWYKDGSKIDSSRKGGLVFNEIAKTDSGNYNLIVYNDRITGLVLRSDTFSITLDECMEITDFKIDVIEQNCASGNTVDIGNSKIEGGTTPFTYTFRNGGSSYQSTTQTTDNLPSGAYSLTVEDVNGCIDSADFNLNRIRECDPVFSPNSDGVGDTYFIEAPGKVVIYDTQRNIIAELEAPLNWDGTTNKGSVVDAGYYVLVHENGETVFLTVVR